MRIGADFLKKFLPGTPAVYIPNPTWGTTVAEAFGGLTHALFLLFSLVSVCFHFVFFVFYPSANHANVFGDAGFKVLQYRYYNDKDVSLDFDNMHADIAAAPNGSIILLHVCAHNPTGLDPTPEQWQSLASLIQVLLFPLFCLFTSDPMRQTKEHVPFFDCAYQGFATGDLARDAFAIRLFAEQGIEFVAAQSFAKNMGLYNERVGAIHAHVRSPAVADRIRSQLRRLVRGSFSNPPAHGARIAATILNDATLYAEWDEQVKVMANRILAMRQALYDALVAKETPGNWTHITRQIGMFCYLGISRTHSQSFASR